MFNSRYFQVYIQIEYGLVVFMLDTINLPSFLCSIINNVSICLFYESFPLLTCHFIYRFFAVTKSAANAIYFSRQARCRPDFIKRYFVQSIVVAICINLTFGAVVANNIRMLE